MTITPESRVGEIAAHHPLATRVFARHGIDFCCGGGVPLAEASAKKGLNPVALVSEIEAELAASPAPAKRWLDAPIPELVEHIVARFHRPLREELPRLAVMAEKVARVHEERDPEGRLPRVVSTLEELTAELLDHMAREEEELFPALLAAAEGSDLGRFLDDHTEAGAALAKLRELADDYRLPEGACNTWRALWAGLEALETTMHEHVHLENNVLFPRAAAAAA